LEDGMGLEAVETVTLYAFNNASKIIGMSEPSFPDEWRAV